jgi:hypothetical protein
LVAATAVVSVEVLAVVMMAKAATAIIRIPILAVTTKWWSVRKERKE